MINTYVGYVDYITGLFVISGLGMLLIDTKVYKKQQMNKERKVASFLGWSNIVLGIGFMAGNWIFV